MKISAIKIGERHRKDMGDLQELAESIKEVGLLHPVVITPDNELIAGHRRLEACKLLGWQYIDVRCIEVEDMLKAEWSENAIRKDFTPSEAVAIGRLLEPMVREQARERQAEHGGTAPGKPKNTSADSAEVSAKNPETRDIVSGAVGMGHTAYGQAKKIVEAAEEDPSLAPLVEEMDSTGNIEPVYKKLREAQGAPVTPPRKKIADRHARIREMAEQAYRPSQIAAEVGISEGQVRNLLSAWGIQSVEAKIGKTKRINGNQTMESLLATIVPSETVLGIIRAEWDSLDTDKFPEWVTRLTQAIQKLRTLRYQLQQETTNG